MYSIFLFSFIYILLAFPIVFFPFFFSHYISSFLELQQAILKYSLIFLQYKNIILLLLFYVNYCIIHFIIRLLTKQDFFLRDYRSKTWKNWLLIPKSSSSSKHTTADCMILFPKKYPESFKTRTTPIRMIYKDIKLWYFCT